MIWFSRNKKVTAKREAKPFTRQALCFQALEPRLLLSADALGGVVDADDIDISAPLLSNYDKIREDLNSKLLQPVVQGAFLTSALAVKSEAVVEQALHTKLDLTAINTFFHSDTPEEVSLEAEDTKTEVTQIVVVDSNIEDLDVLLSDARQDASIHIVTIGADDNALQVMTAEIGNYTDLDSIHIISHGSSGNLQLGNTLINSSFMAETDSQVLFARWQASLADDADLLIYGCDFASGDSGQQALSELSALTGLNVAASDDITGSAQINGDWVLEQTVGEVDTQLIVGLDVQAVWQHSLATIVVNTTDDGGLGWGAGGVDDLLANDEEISLREAIEAIRNDAFGWSGGEAHTIVFDLADGENTINVSSGLPALTSSVVIDGSGDGSGNIRIVGSGLGDVFTVSGDDIELRNLEVSGGANGITISGNNNVVVGCYVLDNSENGIKISGMQNVIGGDQASERNIISGNAGSGIYIDGAFANNNVIRGNYIGILADGETESANGVDGITINTSKNTIIGGTTAGAGNVISGNSEFGINIKRVDTDIPSGHTILGNIVGLNAAGDSAVENTTGIQLWEVTGVDVGDGTEAGRNIVSGNTESGIKIIGQNTEYVTVSGNYVGTDISGSFAIGNGEDGVVVYDGPGATTWGGAFGGFGGFGGAVSVWEAGDTARVYIGGDTPAEGNLISGNGWSGISIADDASYVGIVNNIIGLDINSATDLGNGRHGIWVDVGSSAFDAHVSIISNTIAYNLNNGIIVANSTVGVYVSENQIFGNHELGIDLGDDSVTPNDAADLDSGANWLLNTPEINAVDIVDGELNIRGTIEFYSILASSGVTIEFFYSDSEGENGTANANTYIGSHTVNSTPSNYDVSFAIDIPSGSYITATATSYQATGTSEFSSAMQLEQGNISNSIPEGAVSFTGALVQGATLAAVNTLTDANGMSGVIKYQWRRGSDVIANASEDTYTLQQDDVGQAISVTASYVDDDGYEEFVASEPSALIGNVNDSVEGTVTILGDRIEDGTLTVEYAFEDVDGLPSDYSIQWVRAGEDVAGAEGVSYSLTDADVNTSLSVRVSYIDLYDSPESMSSGVTVAIANVNDAPVGEVSILGAMIEDGALTAQIDLSDADGLGSEFDYQWYRDDVVITGADTESYLLGDKDVGAIITLSVSYEDAQGATEIVRSAVGSAVENINDGPVGSLDLVGSNVDGETLTVQINFTDADGLTGEVNYQWNRDGVAIAGAVGEAFTVGNMDVGSRLSVTATYQDDAGFIESITSELTNTVNNTNESPTGTVTILGDSVEEQSLSVSINLSDADGLPSVYTYQWFRGDDSIVGANQASYMLDDADVGFEITVEVGYEDDLGSTESVLSQASATITSIDDAPTGQILVTGSSIEGQLITAQVNIDDNDGMPAVVDYQWVRGDEAIDAAVSASYELTEQDVDSSLRVFVSYTDLQGYTQTVQSAAFGPIVNLNQVAVGTVDIAGVHQEDEVLEAVLNFTDNDGLPENFSYQWYRDDIALGDATNSQYQLTDADVGKRFSVLVEYIDEHGSEEALHSGSTNLIVNVNDSPIGEVSIIGDGEEGQTLTAIVADIFDADGIEQSMGLQWYRDGNLIDGATEAEYLLHNEDVGAAITVVWQYQDSFGQVETVTSQPLSGILNVNESPVGDVIISGGLTPNQQLAVSHNITDADGNNSGFTYQWYRDDIAINGAEGNTYALSAVDVDASLLVIVSYTDNMGTSEAVASSSVGPIVPLNALPQGRVDIVGLGEEGVLLTVNNTVTDENGIAEALGYQWYRNGNSIDGATASEYLLQDVDVSASITVSWQYEDAYGQIETVTSQPLAGITNVNSSPTGEVIITGAAIEDERLAVGHNLVDSDGFSGSVDYQWFRDGLAVSGANTDSFLLGDSVVSSSLYVVASYTDDRGTFEQVASVETGPIQALNDSPSGALYIIGTAEEDSWLQVERNIEDSDGIVGGLSYQWYRGAEAIDGATAGSYRLSEDDIGSRISVLASYTDTQGTDETVQSEQTEVIVWVNHAGGGELLIQGENTVGSTLRLVDSLQDLDGINGDIHYQWQRDGDAIDGANKKEYLLGREDQGRTLSVLVSYVDDRGFEEVLVSPLVGIATAVLETSIEPVTVSPTFDETVSVIVDEGLEDSVPLQGSSDLSDDSVEVEPKTEGSLATFSGPVGDLFSKVDSLGLENERGLGQNVDLFEFSVSSPSNSLSQTDVREPLGVILAPEADVGTEVVIPKLNELLSLLNEPRYSDHLQDSIQTLDDSHLTLTSATIGGTAVASTSLSVGYLLWTLRSGVLMTSLLSSLPAWRFMDPLPILSGVSNGDDDDGETLESMVEASAESTNVKGAEHE